MWDIPKAVETPPALVDAVGGHPLVARLLWQRGITDPVEASTFLDPDGYRPSPPTDLPGVEEAVSLLLQAREGRRLCVWGDFDVDGQTSIAILVGGLRRLGFDVCYYVPRRDTEGHGLNEAGLRYVIDEQGAELLLTCDTGIANAEEVAFANRRGVDCIITDHHELPDRLPQAAAILNPHLLPDPEHPFRYLCGVGTAYVLLQALFDAIRVRVPQGAGERADEWIDLVALGTIADLAILRDENRYFVQRGLARLLYPLRDPRPGIQALLRTAGASLPELLDTEIVSYTLAPRLNAVGRLDDARMAIELLLCQDQQEALRLAAQLEIYNDRRKQLCDHIQAEIEQRLRENPKLLEMPALVLAGAEWHPGVIGIVASRLVEQYGKPAILLGKGADGRWQASGRSVPGLHLQEAIEEHAHLLERSGGHAMAAGFVADPAQLPAFREAFQTTVEAWLSAPEACLRHDPAAMTAREWVDAVVSLDQITPAFVRELYRLAPFGPGNPAPVLASRAVVLKNVSGLGTNGDHSRLLVEDRSGVRVPAVWWRTAPGDVPDGLVDVAFTVELDASCRDTPTARLVLREARSTSSTAVITSGRAPEPTPATQPLHLVDHRTAPDRTVRLQALLDEHRDVQVWAEGSGVGDAPRGGRARDRTQLKPGRNLVIWTLPPGPRTLQQVLDRVQPQRVYVLTPAAPATQTPPMAFLQRLARVIQAEGGTTTIAAIAATLGQRESTVRSGLAFLAARGTIVYQVLRREQCEEIDGRVHVRAGNGQPVDDGNPEELRWLLQETAAYQRYFSKAPLEVLFG